MAVINRVPQVTDPTTSERGAGAGPNFEGDKQAKRLFKETAGVIEAEPGIIESTNVHPLRPDSNDGGLALPKKIHS
jgi:hypothetical protein